jgi:hypothetical protein
MGLGGVGQACVGGFETQSFGGAVAVRFATPCGAFGVEDGQ